MDFGSKVLNSSIYCFFIRKKRLVVDRVLLKKKEESQNFLKRNLKFYTSFPFRSSPNQTEEDGAAASAGPETQSHDRPAHRHHSDRADRDQGTGRRSAVPSPLRSGCPQGVAHAATTPRQGDVRSRETRDPSRALAQVAGGVESTLQRLGAWIWAWTVPLPGHPLNLIFKNR